MLKISCAGCLGLSPAISAQFTLKMFVAAQNCKKKSVKQLIFEVQGHSRSSVLTPNKAVASACYDKQHVCAYLQPFSH